MWKSCAGRLYGILSFANSLNNVRRLFESNENTYKFMA